MLSKDMLRIHKEAFNIGINPMDMLGAATGAFVAGAQVKSQNANQAKEDKFNHPLITNGNYNHQIKNLDNSLSVMFTPFNVLYVVKDGGKNLTVDMISTDQMTDDMLAHFRGMDKEYFKSILLNKVKMEVNMTEQLFLRRMVDTKSAIEGEFGVDSKSSGISKQSNELFGFMEKEACASLMGKVLEDDYVYVPINLGDIADTIRSASFLSKSASFLPFSKKSEDDKFSDADYLAKNIVVEFLPDRVVFTNNGIVIQQLATIDMNEDGLDAFHDTDFRYFKDFFKEQLGLVNSGENISTLFKHASQITDLRSVFTENFVHPKIYYLLIVNKIGADFWGLDIEILIKKIEEVFMLEAGIGEFALNKIMTIHAINNPENKIFTSFHGFEKAVRAFNDKPIDFADRENNLSLGEMLFALSVMNDLTPMDDIYDNFSEAVLDYIIETLAGNSHRVFVPVASDSENENILMAFIRGQLLEYAAVYITPDNDEDIEAYLSELVELRDIVTAAVTELRDLPEYLDSEYREIVSRYKAKYDRDSIVVNEYVIESEINKNFAVDKLLETRALLLSNQTAELSIGGSE